MMNDLFNETLLKKYSAKFKLTHKQKETVREYVEMIEKGEFKGETQNYLNFYDMILKDILGYERVNVNFDQKVDDGAGRSEFVLKSGNKKFMVVELKGQGTDLDKKQSRQSDTRTPVDQAFGYAIHTGDVEWILLSNYNEFRLYNYHEKTKYISFNASEILDNEKLKQFLLIFSKKSHIDSNYIEHVHNETQFVERKLENEFYKLYNETRLMLIKELEEHKGFDRIKAVHYAQLILNRYMFICFAEDIDLLPSQISISTITEPIKLKKVKRNSIWNSLNDLFLDIYESNPEREIFDYNGGQFEEDIGFIQINDLMEDKNFFKDTFQQWKFEDHSIDIETLITPYNSKINPIYKNLLTISSFDFSTDLDVDILGHIFENSIGDIEELKEDAKGRRKKEGIFYTPEYITDSICRNTIIPYLSKSGNSKSVPDLIQEYSFDLEIETLESKLMNIKIIDMACGSGAFLNKASDILLEIHKAVYEFKKRKYTSTIETKGGKGKDKIKRKATHSKLDSFFDEISTRRRILIHNIYGVDLNEESVEITKLALFLKVCQKEKKLPDIEKNIKCGNSLIDDPKFTDKAFNWKKEFPEIFINGGFDIVIGNPPYVRQEKIKEIKPFLENNYKVYTGKSDLYSYFFERGIEILKHNGYLGFISSNKFIKANYGKKLRKYILENSIFKVYVDHTWDSVFADATTYPSVFVLVKGTPDEKNVVWVDNKFEVYQSRLNSNDWCFQDPKISKIRDKIESRGLKIKEFNGINIYYGIKTGYNKAFIIDNKTKDDLINEDSKNKELIKPLLRGRDLKRWKINFDDYYLLFIDWEFDINNYPSIKNYLSKFKTDLEKRPAVKNGTIKWFVLSSYGSTYHKKFESPKLIYPVIAPKLLAVYDEENFYINDKCFMITSDEINLKYLGTLLSSNVLNFIFTMLSSSLQGNYYELRKIYIEQLPIYRATSQEQQPFIEKADIMITLNKELMNEINQFRDWLMHTFNIIKLSQKLEKYYDLQVDDFLNEVKKKKVDIKSRNNYQTLKQEFEKSILVIAPLQQQIKETDREIDQMVYDLYGLTQNEIKSINDTLKV